VNAERDVTTYPAQLAEFWAALAVPPVWLTHGASLAGAVADTIETLATESDTPMTAAISPRDRRIDVAVVNVRSLRAGVQPRA
jgi:hypothetical protein